MAATRGQKLRMAKELGMFFAELGRIPSRKEYSKLPNRPRTSTVKEIDRIAGSWNGLITMIRREQPELWELANKAPEPEFKVEKPKPPKIDIPMAKLQKQKEKVSDE